MEKLHIGDDNLALKLATINRQIKTENGELRKYEKQPVILTSKLRNITKLEIARKAILDRLKKQESKK